MTLSATEAKTTSTVTNAVSELQSVNDLIKAEVHNKEGKKLGTVKDLMIDTLNAQLSYALLSFGGFWGMRESLSAIPWNALRFDLAAKHYVLDIDMEKLKASPSYNADNKPNMNDKQWVNKVNKYFIKQVKH